MADGFGEGEGVPMPSANAGAAIEAARVRASASDFMKTSKNDCGVFLMYAPLRRADDLPAETEER